jgi:NAD(P)H-hydrate epimerase
LKSICVPEVTDIELAFKSADHIVDALFGFSFKPPIRDPFPAVIQLLSQTKLPVTSVDIPSSWDVDEGPAPDNKFHPSNLVSLTAPKPAAKFFHGRHFVGGRFIGKEFANKYQFDIPDYAGIDQVVEVENGNSKM